METPSPYNPELISGFYDVYCDYHGLIATGLSITTAFNTKSDHQRNFHCHPTEIDIVEGAPNDSRVCD